MIPTCRICMSSEESDDLCCPCDCKGTNKWVHGKCQIRWIIRSKRIDCEICGYKWVVPMTTKNPHAYIDSSKILDDIFLGFVIFGNALVFYARHIIIKIVS